MGIVIVLLVAVVVLESIEPGMGVRLISGLLALIVTIAASLPAGAVIGALLLLPAYLAGWNGAVDAAYQDDIDKANANRAKRTKRWP